MWLKTKSQDQRSASGCLLFKKKGLHCRHLTSGWCQGYFSGGFADALGGDSPVNTNQKWFQPWQDVVHPQYPYLVLPGKPLSGSSCEKILRLEMGLLGRHGGYLKYGQSETSWHSVVCGNLRFGGCTRSHLDVQDTCRVGQNCGHGDTPCWIGI